MSGASGASGFAVLSHQNKIKNAISYYSNNKLQSIFIMTVKHSIKIGETWNYIVMLIQNINRNWLKCYKTTGRLTKS